MSDFSNQLIKWYRLNFRQLPWRETIDPYKIWLSEVILQQTRVAQGLPYFQKFSKRFPTVSKLANAQIDDVLKLWQGLGYYSRARNLHHTAQLVMENFNGKFPSHHADLISLKGIGEYTAAAVSSFAANEPHAVVDGNVSRVISRYFGIKDPIDSTLGKKTIRALADEHLDRKKPGLHNQAIMEFGALQCVPRNPDCGACPLVDSCVAFRKGKVGEWPVKLKKNVTRDRYFDYLIMHDGKNMLMRRREGKDIWHGLYEFPLKESTDRHVKSFPAQWVKWIGTKTRTESGDVIRHLLSHQKLHVKFHVVEMKRLPAVANHILVPLKKKGLPGVPQVILKYLDERKWFKA